MFGIPDEKWGETPVAAVVLREPDSVGEDELREWINARVAARYQRVARVIVMSGFPAQRRGQDAQARDARAVLGRPREEDLTRVTSTRYSE